MFTEPKMKAFSGKLVVVVQSGTEPGDIQVVVSGKNGVERGKIELISK